MGERQEILVELTWAEMLMGALTGAMRNISSLMKKSKASVHSAANLWTIHIEGACGEIAAAKALKRCWMPTVDTYSAADIAPDIEVRTRSEHHYELRVRREDAVHHRFVLVTGKAPRFVVRGWLPGKDAQRDEWWIDPSGKGDFNWFVPQDHLRDIRELMPKP